jgi:outer membrane protein, heavy metal efflux system
MKCAQGLFIVMVLTTTTFAQPADHLALADVVADALKANPEITAAEQRYAAARLRPVQERSLPDPMVSAGYNASGKPFPGAGLGTEPIANIGFMVTQELPYPGKRQLRGTIAAREADAVSQDIDVARLNITSRVKQAYYRLAYTYAVGDVLTRNRALLETLLKVSEGRYAVGHAAQQDVIKAQTQFSILELQQLRIAQERATRAGELNALLNRPPLSPLGRPDDLVLTPFDEALDALVLLAAQHAPMLQRERIMVDRAQLSVDSARKEFRPDFAFTGGYYYMGAMPAMYEFRFDVKVPFQRARRAAAVAEQLSVVDAARSTYESSRLTVQAQLQEDYQLASTTERLAGLYHDTVLPQARFALESSMASYQTGAVDFLSVLSNFGSVLEYEMTYFAELTSFHTAVSRLEAMTGAALVP